MTAAESGPPPRLVYALPGMEAVAVRRDAPYTAIGEPDLLLDVYGDRHVNRAESGGW